LSIVGMAIRKSLSFTVICKPFPCDLTLRHTCWQSCY
jgi:hypothetical protein